MAVVALAWLPSLARDYGGEYRAEGRVVGAREDFGTRWSGPPDWVEDADLRDLVDWIRANAGADAVLALGEPWPYTFFTGRPSTLLPLDLDAPTLRRFVAEYRVSYVLVSGRDRRRRPYGEYLSALAADGVRQQSVGRYAVYATGALWR